MTGYKEHSGALRNTQGFSLLEIMTVVAVLGILATFAFPSTRRMLDRQEAKASATQVAGLLADARARALSEGTPHLVYFNAPGADPDGECVPIAVEVRDSDHSYSITDGDQTREFKLSEKACKKVKQYGDESEATAELAAITLPVEDRAVRAPDAESVGIVPTGTGTVAGAVGAVAGAVGGAVGGSAGGAAGSSSGEDEEGSSGSGSSGSGSSGSGSSGSGSSGSGSSGSGSSATVAAAGKTALSERTATIAETVVNGATFPVDPADGRPVIAFSERGVAVDPANRTAWGSGAGGIYLTDGDSTVYAAVVGPLGEVQLRVFDTGSSTWR